MLTNTVKAVALVSGLTETHIRAWDVDTLGLFVTAILIGILAFIDILK